MQRQLTFNFPKRVCFFSGRPMLQLKLYFPHLPKCIRGITTQCCLPIPAEGPPPNVPAPERSTPPRNKKSWHQPALFE